MVPSSRRLEAVVTADADTIRKADRLILPGVGAFADAIDVYKRQVWRTPSAC